MNKVLWILLVYGLLLGTNQTLSAQTAEPADSALFKKIDPNKPRKWLALPSVYYTPETRWAFGAIGLGFFRFNKSDTLSPLSNAGISFAYTLNDQILFSLPFNLFLKGDRYRIKGEMAFYRYPYFFAGVGNDFPRDYSELYSASFPRFELTATYRFSKHWFTGPRVFMQNTTMTETEESGLLASGLVAGGEGGVTTGLGWEFIGDYRDNIYSPYQGHYLRLSMLFFDETFASDFSFNQFQLDLRKYFNLGKNHIIAVQGYGEYNFGETPFNRMAQLGGPNIMRGYKRGTYRDHHLMAAQIEYRTPIWYFFGLTAFAGTGAVARTFNDFQTDYLRPTYGLGLRLTLNKKERINIRFDYARGEYEDEFYLTLIEAF